MLVPSNRRGKQRRGAATIDSTGGAAFLTLRGMSAPGSVLDITIFYRNSIAGTPNRVLACGQSQVSSCASLAPLIAALSLLPLERRCGSSSVRDPRRSLQTGAAGVFSGTEWTKALMLIGEIVNGQAAFTGSRSSSTRRRPSTRRVRAVWSRRSPPGKRRLIVGPASCDVFVEHGVPRAERPVRMPRRDSTAANSYVFHPPDATKRR